MSSIAERLRARRMQQPNIPMAPAPQLPELSQVQTPPNPHPQESGNPLTTQSSQPIEPVEDFAALSLEERTVRFFTVITEGLPIVGDNPLLRALMHRLGPLLVKELQGLSPDDLQRVFQGMFVSLGQVYQPGAAAIVIDLRQQHVLTQEVEIAVGPLPEATDHAEVPALPDVIDEAEVLSPPPPAPPDIVDEDDVMVGVLMPDGVTVVAMRQSQRDALMREAAAS